MNSVGRIWLAGAGLCALAGCGNDLMQGDGGRPVPDAAEVSDGGAPDLARPPPPPAAFWTSEGGGNSVSGHLELDTMIGGSIVAGESAAHTGETVTFGG